MKISNELPGFAKHFYAVNMILSTIVANDTDMQTSNNIYGYKAELYCSCGARAFWYE